MVNALTRATSRTAGRLWAVFVLVLLALMTGFLVGPRSPANEQEKHCVANLVTSSPFGLSLGCDAYLNLHLARAPERLLEPGNFRQSRPLLAIPAYLIRPLFLWAKDMPATLGIRAAPDMQPFHLQFTPALLENDFPGFLAYVLINMLELAAAFAIYLRLVAGSATGRGWDFSAAAVVAIGAIGFLLLANDVMKAFVFNAHVQMFNILAPLLGVLVLAKPASSPKRAAAIGFAAGIGVLAYPLLAIVVACYGLRALIDLYSERNLRVFLLRGVLVVVMAAVPVLAWYYFVLWRVGSFYSDSMAYRQLIWVADSYAAGTLLADLSAKFGGLSREAARQAVALAAMFGLALLLLVVNRRRARFEHGDAMLVAAALLTSLVVLVFHALAGFTMARVAYGILPPLIVICGVLARAAYRDERSSVLAWGAAAVFGAIIIAQMVYTVVKAGPYG